MQLISSQHYCCCCIVAVISRRGSRGPGGPGDRAWPLGRGQGDTQPRWCSGGHRSLWRSPQQGGSWLLSCVESGRWRPPSPGDWQGVPGAAGDGQVLQEGARCCRRWWCRRLVAARADWRVSELGAAPLLVRLPRRSAWRPQLAPGYCPARPLTGSAVKRSIGSTTGFHNHGEGPY